MNTLLLATDGSPSAELATDQAIDLAAATHWQLRVVTVWHAPIAVYGYEPIALPIEVSEAEKKHATRVAEAAVERAQRHGVEATWELREGEPAEEICTAARESQAQLIVIGAHGWGTVKRVLFGSVSTRVMHEAPCGVLVVRDGEHPAVDRPYAYEHAAL